MDIKWLDDLSVDDHFAALDQALQWLADFAAEAGSAVRPRLEMLRNVEERSTVSAAALAARYIDAPSLSHERENRKWELIYGYYRAFAQAYQALLIATQKIAAQSESSPELPVIVARSLYYLGRCAKWCFFRYQEVPQGGWVQMHKLYELAEQSGFADLTIQPWVAEQEASCTAIYLRTLMLDTLNHTSMTKKEIDLADRWLEQWARLIPLQRQFEKERQLFYVNLTEDRGGRHIRNLQPTSSCRYWDTEAIVKIIEQARGDLQQGKQITEPELGEDAEGLDYPLMYGYLLAEWSCDHYVRQRRKAERAEVRKVTQAVHGIFNVCQHVKNLMVFRDRGIDAETNTNLHEDDDERKKWIINESPYGFGAIVNLEADTWLGVGKLVALDYENNRGLPVIGVLRSIKLLTDQKCLVGIDVLSHIPTCVLLRESETAVPSDDQPLEALLVSALTFEGMPRFPGLYLPRVEEGNIPSTLIIPHINFMAAGVYEMRMENHLYLVRLGAVMEHRDDWVRTEIKIVRQGTHAG